MACRVLLLECLLESKCESFVLTRSGGKTETNLTAADCKAQQPSSP